MHKADQPSAPGACIEVTGPLGTVQVTIQDKVCNLIIVIVILKKHINRVDVRAIVYQCPGCGRGLCALIAFYVLVYNALTNELLIRIAGFDTLCFQQDWRPDARENSCQLETLLNNQATLQHHHDNLNSYFQPSFKLLNCNYCMLYFIYCTLHNQSANFVLELPTQITSKDKAKRASCRLLV